MSEPPAIENTRRWVERVVVGLNLCPFAHAEVQAHRVRYRSTETEETRHCLALLAEEMSLLAADESIGTTLLICGKHLKAFDDYLGVLTMAEELVRLEGHEGRFQIASFHPDYQFAGSDPKDPANLSNRSPYPMFHILRESEIEKVLARTPHPEEIPRRNQALCRKLGLAAIRALMD